MWRAVDDTFTPYLRLLWSTPEISGACGLFADRRRDWPPWWPGLGFAEVRTLVIDLPVHFADADQLQAFSMSMGSGPCGSGA